jgi:hypothetical protein
MRAKLIANELSVPEAYHRVRNANEPGESPGSMQLVQSIEKGSGLVAAAAALRLAALGAILFLRADEAQATPVLANDAGPFNTLLESPKQLIERFGILDLNPHA